MASAYIPTDPGASGRTGKAPEHTPQQPQETPETAAEDTPPSVLPEDDALFLNRHMSHPSDPVPAPDSTTPTPPSPALVQDDGTIRAASSEESGKGGGDQVVLPETRPEVQRRGTGRARRDWGAELPSQEEAEEAMRGFDGAAQGEGQADAEGEGVRGGSEGKRSWASYLPGVKSGSTVRTSSKAEGEAAKAPTSVASAARDAEMDDYDTDVTEPPTTSTQRTPPQTWAEYAQNYMPVTKEPQQTWAQYARDYIPNASVALPSMQALSQSWKGSSKKTDASSSSAAETTADEKTSAPDPTTDDIPTPPKPQTQTQELTALLTSLNLTPLQSRLIPLSAETRALSASFAQILRDLISGAPTAYDDMEKFMKQAGPRLEAQWKGLPPVVKGLVRGLPVRVAPLMAGGKGKAKAEGETGGSPGGDADAEVEVEEGGEKKKKKKKRAIPGLKALASQQGAVGTLLRNVVEFLQTRFPFLASGTNVVMSLAVFILMFVFWYCYKRGKETRLAREAEEGRGSGAVSEEEAQGDEKVDGPEEGEQEDREMRGVETGREAVGKRGSKSAEEVLNQPEPSSVPLPKEESADGTAKGA